LQRLSLVPGRADPDVTLFFVRQDHRHRFGMNRCDDRVRSGSEKAVDEMRTGDRFRLRPAVTFELGPNPGEGE
jgi:hypothetical protein